LFDIVLMRIDDRLIHGQVMTGWLRSTGANRIFIVDDIVAKDQFSLSLFKMASPPGVSVDAYTVEDAVKLLNDPNSPDEKVIVLAKSPVAPLSMISQGVKVESLNVGGMGSRPGRKPYFRNISASSEELQMLRDIQAKGIPVEFRIVPDDKPKLLDS
jgi:mannose/fructose/N-acetylgalactosamine-specific phosphotransferase system component IIB